MLQYKSNLAILRHRYTDIERQLLKAFVRKLQEMDEQFKGRGFPPYDWKEPGLVGFGNLRIHDEMWWTVSNLLDDGLIEFREETMAVLAEQERQRHAKVILLTEKGREFLTHWIKAEPIA